MPVIVLLVFFLVAVPIIELFVTILVADAIGWLNALGLMLLVSLLGIVVVRHQGLGVWARVRRSMADGVVPTPALVDGLLILVAGLFLMVPGFVTDVVAILLLVPPVRRGMRALLRSHYAGRVVVRDVRYRRSTEPPTSPPELS